MSQDIDRGFKRSLNCLPAIKSFQQLSDSSKKYPLDKTTFTLEIYHYWIEVWFLIIVFLLC